MAQIATLATFLLVFFSFCSSKTSGEPSSSYRQYRILSGTGYGYGYGYGNYYPQYYAGNSKYTTYANPAYYSSNNVYVTDKYGRTTIQNGGGGGGGGGGGSSYYTAMSYAQDGSCSSCTCTANTCGQGAQCQVVGGRPVCSCLRGYSGDPLTYCRRAECLDNSDCRGHLTCIGEKCQDPCAGACGSNANCDARNHVPVCSCPAGHTGNPFSGCRLFDPVELCHPSPCGPNTNCDVRNGVPTCTCLPGYHGSPLAGCRHECESDSECGPTLACLEFKCQNPCTTQCGTNAECENISNHRAVCKCPKNYFGNPYSSCKPECYGDSDCPSGRPACYYGICKSPCEGACGLGANCELRGLTPVCSCPRDMTGNPFVSCRPFEARDLCEPENPCGVNAHCEPGHDRTGKERPVCTCPVGYTGDPLVNCIRGECVSDVECPDSQACIDYRCQNPCAGKCGVNANCDARRHLAVCTCPTGYTGDAAIQCYPNPSSSVSSRYRALTYCRTC